MKILEYNRVSLSDIDTLVAGELIYPPTSLLPYVLFKIQYIFLLLIDILIKATVILTNMIILRRLNGLAEGVSSLIHSVVRQEWSSFTSVSSTAQFEPRYYPICV